MDELNEFFILCVKGSKTLELVCHRLGIESRPPTVPEFVSVNKEWATSNSTDVCGSSTSLQLPIDDASIVDIFNTFIHDFKISGMLETIEQQL